MEVTKWLKPSGSVSRIGEPRLPLWVKPAHRLWCGECPHFALFLPLYPQEQTFWTTFGMSHVDPQRKSRLTNS